MQYLDLDFPSRDQVTERFNDTVRYFTSKYVSNKGHKNTFYIYPRNKAIIEDRIII